MAVITDAEKKQAAKRYVYKRDKARHHQLMDRESNPYLPSPNTKLVVDDMPKRVEYNPDKSGLGKMRGSVTRRVSDHYDALRDQEVRMRKQRMDAVGTEISDADRAEINEWLRANNMNRRV